jgi:hypothetical protein
MLGIALLDGKQLKIMDRKWAAGLLPPFHIVQFIFGAMP